MVEMTAKESSRWWWFDSHNSSKRSPWLHSTLTELDGKTKAMLKLIEEDADSFAQRAEMYYKKRPELISMVEDFYRAHRSLAERYDQMKSEIGTRLPTTFGSPFSSTKHKPQKLMNVMDQTYYSYSGTSDAEDYAESEVDDPEQEDVIYAENVIEEEVEDPELVNEPEVDEGLEWENEIQVDQELAEDSVSSEVCDDETIKLMEEIEEVDDPELENEAQVDQELAEDYASSGVCDDETVKLREELERLKEENLMQRNQLMQKDEEKREVIRQLSLTAGMLKDENTNLRKHIALKKQSPPCPFQFSKLKAFFMGSN